MPTNPPPLELFSSDFKAQENISFPDNGFTLTGKFNRAIRFESIDYALTGLFAVSCLPSADPEKPCGYLGVIALMQATDGSLLWVKTLSQPIKLNGEAACTYTKAIRFTCGHIRGRNE